MIVGETGREPYSVLSTATTPSGAIRQVIRDFEKKGYADLLVDLKPNTVGAMLVRGNQIVILQAFLL